MSIFANPPGLLPWGTYVDINPLVPPTTGRFPFAVSLFRSIALVQWSQLVICPILQTAVNFWTIEVHRYIDSALVASQTTIGVSAATNTLLVSTNFNIQSLGAADHGLYLQCISTGAPGNLLCIAPALEFIG